MKVYLELAFANLAAFVLDWWVWELTVMIAGIISIQVQASQVILNNIQIFFLMISAGFQIAVSAQVGNKIG